MRDLLFALDAVLPLFLLIALGYLGARRGFISDSFRASLGPFVYKLSLPLLVFNSVYGSDFSRLFSPRLSAFLAAATLLSIGLAAGLSRLVSAEAGVRGSFIQGCFRGNYVILALPLIGEVFGEEGRAEAALLLAFLYPIYNVGSIIVLSLHARRSEGGRGLLGSLLGNPLLIALAAALPFAIFRIPLPRSASRSIEYLADLAVPLALLDVGAGLRGKGAGRRGGAIAWAVAWKVLATPLLFTLGAAAFGIAGRELGIVYFVGAAPTAIVSYTIASSLGCDAETAGGIVVWSTLAALPAYLAGIWILRGAGLI